LEFEKYNWEKLRRKRVFLSFFFAGIIGGFVAFLTLVITIIILFWKMKQRQRRIVSNSRPVRFEPLDISNPTLIDVPEQIVDFIELPPICSFSNPNANIDKVEETFFY
jgi:hypothetical protein